MRKELILILALVTLLLLSACSASQEEAPAPVVEEAAAGDVEAPEEMAPEAESQPEHPAGDAEMVEQMSDEPAGEAEMVEQMSDEAQEMAAEPEAEEAMNLDLPAWQTLALTNARTGESFALSDFAGKTVFVEPMATWCSNCRRQLGNVKDARAQLAAEDVIFDGLSVETTIDDATLAGYADDAGFDWLFAVVTPEMLQELAAEFGPTIANPPATPHFVIRPDGSATELVTGIEPAGEIIAQIQAAQG
jgi:thiol-disulfide isomerase/thioredoxin